MKKFMGRTMAKMHENRRNGRTALKGFTLVEIIVVLVILAILAAAMIPALTGYIDKAKERSGISEARNVLTAAQTLASEEYGLHGATAAQSFGSTADNKSAITGLAEVEGTIDAITISNRGKVTNLTYTTKAGAKIVYKDGEFTFTAES